MKFNGAWTADLPLTTPRYTLKATSPLAAVSPAATIDSAKRPTDLTGGAPRLYAKGANANKVAIGCYQASTAQPLVLIVR